MLAWRAGVETSRNSIRNKIKKKRFQALTKDAESLYAFLHFKSVSQIVCKLNAFTETIPLIQNKLACMFQILGHSHSVR